MGCITKWLAISVVGLLLLGSIITIKENYFPTSEVKIEEIRIQLDEKFQLNGIELTINKVELTEERNEFAKQDRVLKVTYMVKNGTENRIPYNRLPIQSEEGNELYEYGMLTGNADYVEKNETMTFKDYYQLPEKVQDYMIKVYSSDTKYVGHLFRL